MTCLLSFSVQPRRHPASIIRRKYNRIQSITSWIWLCHGLEDAPYHETSQSRHTGLSWTPMQLQMRPRKKRSQSTAVYPSSPPVQLHIHCSEDSWSCRRVCVGLSAAAWMPHHQNKCWAMLIHVCDAVSQCCCGAWQCRLCRRHCTIHQ